MQPHSQHQARVGCRGESVATERPGESGSPPSLVRVAILLPYSDCTDYYYSNYGCSSGMSCLATPLRHLAVSRAQLSLAGVCTSGQSFRWHRAEPARATADAPQSADADEWSLAHRGRTVVLRQDGARALTLPSRESDIG